MLIRDAKASDADHLVRFVNMAADELSLHFWKKSAGPGVDPISYGRERAARDARRAKADIAAGVQHALC